MGFYKAKSGTIVSLVEHLNASKWELESTPNAEGAQESKLTSISCTSSASCSAVGFYKSSSGTIVALAESLNESTWAIQPASNPEGAQESQLTGVSCGALGACTAVGWSKQATGSREPVSEIWNGREWQLWAAPSPSGSEAGELQDVSCVSMYACEAAGTYANSSSKAQQSLAEGLGAPGVSQQPSSTVSSGAVTLDGLVDPNQWSTSYRFEYGETTSYGSSIPVPELHLFSESTGEEVRQVLPNLRPGVTYHFRLVATNFVGTTYSADSTFAAPDPTFVNAFTHYDNPEVKFSEPNAVAVDSSGNIWVAEGGRNHVLEFNSEHKFLRQLGETGEGVGQFKGIGGIAANSSGDIYVTDSGNNRVQEFGPAAEHLRTFGSASLSGGQLLDPIAIAIDSSGDVWVANYVGGAGDRIVEFSAKAKNWASLAQTARVAKERSATPLVWRSRAGICISPKWKTSPKKETPESKSSRPSARSSPSSTKKGRATANPINPMASPQKRARATST